ncbi:hypothetical protein ACSQ67_025788 [Phaseolus vulgaris]
MEGNAKSDQIVDVGSVVEAVSADDGDAPLYSLESLCMRCGENVCLVYCSICSCDWQVVTVSRFCYQLLNVHIVVRGTMKYSFAGEIQPRGCCYTLKIPSNEQKIPELDFEIPPEAQRGSLSTLKNSMLMPREAEKAVTTDQVRREPHGSVGATAAIEPLHDVKFFAFFDNVMTFPSTCGASCLVVRLECLSPLFSLEEPWTLILDDALANSFVAPAIDDPKEDNQLAFEDYERSWEQNEELGLNDMDTSSAEVGDAPTNTSKTE